MELALNDVSLRLEAGSEAVDKEQLQLLSAQFLNMRREQDRLSKRYHSVVLDVIRRMPQLSPNDCENEATVAAWFDSLRERLLLEKGEGASYNIEVFSSTGGKDFGGKVTINTHSVESSNIFTPDFFASGEYVDLTALENQHELKGAVIKRGDKEQVVSTLSEAFEWLLKEASQGLHIQRYKGLGEMNPDQLWETTMDANSRRMSQVRIEDAVAADEIFTTLMGDQVEPRREFIELNALTVENLDT
jgi:DNA gyrase subunit B